MNDETVSSYQDWSTLSSLRNFYRAGKTEHLCIYVCMYAYVCVYISIYVCMYGNYIYKFYAYIYIYTHSAIVVLKDYNSWIFIKI